MLFRRAGCTESTAFTYQVAGIARHPEMQSSPRTPRADMRITARAPKSRHGTDPSGSATRTARLALRSWSLGSAASDTCGARPP
eukprot:6025785-Prymnesium_polylepis.1